MTVLATPRVERLVVAGVALLGVALRLPWLASTGYAGDVEMYRGWGVYVAGHGIGAAYAAQDVTHGPVWLALVGGVAWLWQRVAPALSGQVAPVPIVAIKLPLIAADLGTAWLLYRFARRSWGAPASVGLAALYALNPVVIFDSAWWGQTDGLAAFFVVAAVTELERGRLTLGGAAAAVGVLTKLQAWFLVPTAVIETARSGSKRGLAGAAAGALCAAALLVLPLLAAGTLPDFVAKYLGLVGRHPLVHVGAFNAWWLALGWDGYFMRDDVRTAGGLTYRQVGLIALALYSAAALAVAWRQRPANRCPALLSACLAMAFFTLSTQMHTRYVYPVLPLLLVVAVQRPASLAAYGVLTVTFALNQAFFIAQTTGPSFEIIPPPPPLDAIARVGLGPTTAAAANLLLMASLTWWLVRPSARRLEPSAATARYAGAPGVH